MILLDPRFIASPVCHTTHHIPLPRFAPVDRGIHRSRGSRPDWQPGQDRRAWAPGNSGAPNQNSSGASLCMRVDVHLSDTGRKVSALCRKADGVFMPKLLLMKMLQ